MFHLCSTLIDLVKVEQSGIKTEKTGVERPRSPKMSLKTLIYRKGRATTFLNVINHLPKK